MLQYAHQNSCAWGSEVCSATAQHGNLSILKWLRQRGCPWDSSTSLKAAISNNLGLLRWARQQQPPCPLWDHQDRFQLNILSPCMFVFLAQQHAHLQNDHHAQACVCATAMTDAFLLLKAALPDKTPHEVLLSIVSLAF